MSWLAALILACGSVAVEAVPATPAVAAETPQMVVAIGAAAPGFTLTDTEGTSFDLAAMKGKTVVLEWFNPDCPFVVYAHGTDGPLRTLPGQWLAKDVVWVAINSGAPGAQGHGLERNRAARVEYAMSYPVLLDEDGRVGKQYGATNTPHTFVVGPDGNLAYQGALDDAPRGERSPAGGASRGWLDDALRAVVSGQAPAVPQTKAYGCGVKYAI